MVLDSIIIWSAVPDFNRRWCGYPNRSQRCTRDDLISSFSQSCNCVNNVDSTFPPTSQWCNSEGNTPVEISKNILVVTLKKKQNVNWKLKTPFFVSNIPFPLTDFMVKVVGATPLRNALRTAPYHLQKQLRCKLLAAFGLSLNPLATSAKVAKFVDRRFFEYKKWYFTLERPY